MESFNPYPLLGAPSLPCWPRGMPLRTVLNDDNNGDDEDFQLYQNKIYTNMSDTKFAVLQSVADIQPDVDAIYRLIRGTPFSFVRPEPIFPENIRKRK